MLLHDRLIHDALLNKSAKYSDDEYTEILELVRSRNINLSADVTFRLTALLVETNSPTLVQKILEVLKPSDVLIDRALTVHLRRGAPTMVGIANALANAITSSLSDDCRREFVQFVLAERSGEALQLSRSLGIDVFAQPIQTPILNILQSSSDASADDIEKYFLQQVSIQELIQQGVQFDCFPEIFRPTQDEAYLECYFELRKLIPDEPEIQAQLAGIESVQRGVIAGLLTKDTLYKLAAAESRKHHDSLPRRIRNSSRF